MHVHACLCFPHLVIAISKLTLVLFSGYNWVFCCTSLCSFAIFRYHRDFAFAIISPQHLQSFPPSVSFAFVSASGLVCNWGVAHFGRRSASGLTQLTAAVWCNAGWIEILFFVVCLSRDLPYGATIHYWSINVLNSIGGP